MPLFTHHLSPRWCHLMQVIAILILLTACADEQTPATVTSTSQQADAAAPQADTTNDRRPAIKRVFAGAIAGQYAELCHDYSEEGMPKPAATEKIVITKTGVVSSGIGSVDFVAAEKATLTLSIDRSNDVMIAGIDISDDIHDDINDERRYQIGVQHHDKHTNALFDYTSRTAKRSIGCVGAAPKALTVDLWTTILSQLDIAPVTVSCRGAQSQESAALTISLQRAELRIDGQAYTAENAGDKISLTVNDRSIVYGFSSKSGIHYDVFMEPNGTLSFVQTHRDGELYNCY